MGSFQITDKQFHILQAAVSQDKIRTGAGSGYYYHDRDCQHMVKRGWLKRVYVIAQPGRFYEVTELGRTVARQLGIQTTSGRDAGEAVES